MGRLHVWLDDGEEAALLALMANGGFRSRSDAVRSLLAKEPVPSLSPVVTQASAPPKASCNGLVLEALAELQGAVAALQTEFAEQVAKLRPKPVMVPIAMPVPDSQNPAVSRTPRPSKPLKATGQPRKAETRQNAKTEAICAIEPATEGGKDIWDTPAPEIPKFNTSLGSGPVPEEPWRFGVYWIARCEGCNRKRVDCTCSCHCGRVNRWRCEAGDEFGNLPMGHLTEG